MTRLFTWEYESSEAGASPEENFDMFTKMLSEVRPRLAFLYMQLDAFVDIVDTIDDLCKDHIKGSEAGNAENDVHAMAQSLKQDAVALQRICRWHQEVAESLGDVVSPWFDKVLESGVQHLTCSRFSR